MSNMQLYKNTDKGSSILQYKTGKEFIIIQFKNNKTLEFTYDRAGKERVERMKHLASMGYGLQRYILKKAHYKHAINISI